MSSRTTSPSSRRLSRDTGFPEPFDRSSNTTLPHPDADLSPNACISDDDLAGDHALKRKRLSFLHRHKNKRSLAHGFISPQSELVSSVLTLTLTDTGGHFKGRPDAQKLANPNASTTSFRSKDGTESEQSKKDEDTPPTSPDSAKQSNKSGFLSKWRRG